MLTGKVALVTGASRGVGRGVALGLAEAGAKVFASARTLDGEGSLAETVESSAGLEGEVIAVACDHCDDEQTEAVFSRIAKDAGRLDVLVNNAWGAYENMMEDGEFTWPKPFWEQPRWRWDAAFSAGLRPAFVCSQLAAPTMLGQGSGLIVNISFWAAQKYIGNTIYGVQKCATDRLTLDMAHELEGSGVTAVSLYPGLVRTELVMQSAEFLDLSNSESPQFVGRAVAHLAADAEVGRLSGTPLVAAELASHYGFVDVDGKRPAPLTPAEV